MDNQTSKPIAILGAGSWGTALALYLSRRGQHINIWSIDASEIDAMLKDKANNRYLPGHPLPDTLKPHVDITETIRGVQDILIVVPSVGYRQTLTLIKPQLGKDMRIVCATKGIDADTCQLLGSVTHDVLGTTHPFAVLSGPSFAKEVAAGLPCAVMIASEHADFRHDLIQRFNSPIFRAYPTNDVTGVEVGGVVKNVIAIATGMFDGMNLGANARSALITHGLAEITRLGLALGGKAETFTGLSGLGDLILTCSDDQSRNRRMGLALGKGKKVDEAEKEIGQVVEGKRNAELAVKMAAQHNIDMPICQTIWQILQGKVVAKDAVAKLLAEI